jgi:hypothetical protein
MIYIRRNTLIRGGVDVYCQSTVSDYRYDLHIHDADT